MLPRRSSALHSSPSGVAAAAMRVPAVGREGASVVDRLAGRLVGRLASSESVALARACPAGGSRGTGGGEEANGGGGA